MVRSLLLVTLLATACGSRAPAGPAWPAASTTAEDGGESIAPRGASVATSLEKAPDVKRADDDDQDAAEPAKPAAPSGEKAGDKPAPESSDADVDDDGVIVTDEIIIDIDDDEDIGDEDE